MNKFTLTQLRSDVSDHLTHQFLMDSYLYLHKSPMNVLDWDHLVDFVIVALIGDNYYLTLHLHPFATIEFKESKQSLDFGHYMREDGRRF